ncbi:uncharacterized protein EDB93DRAFT_784974 [Suillus bovinus]|uniref:uncharacterized protein n=1 Tax=Suillus bovinus TaxID=48563 RepID=UPI001B860111|nr:uncharacterized protein EDB93DRAFT_784974 [Suillus bovinus]KAG2136347.1 hypothetical protein EDB93DRAFT_784974 [Suillus bovinus]
MMYASDLEVQQILLCIYAVLAGNSILIYDHMVTLPEEIAFIWRRPKALSAILFLLNRYVALLSNICALVMDFVPVSDKVLQFYYACSQRLTCLQLISVELLEICAIQTTIRFPSNTNRLHKRLLTWMAVVMIALTGLACAGTLGKFSGDIELVSDTGCDETFSKMVAALYRICKINSLLRFSLVTRKNIIDIIFRDGAMFFGAMTLTNILNTLTYYIGSVGLRGSLSTFTG